MLRNAVLLVLLVTAMAFIAGCTKPTKVIGTLKLQAGQAGDVQNSRVELYISSDLTGDPVMYVSSLASGSANSSDFELTDVIEGYYYVLAWKDLDNSTDVSDGDIVGVYAGTYHPGEGGERINVLKGKTFDCGDITMLVYLELETTISGSRSQGGAVTDFSYSFNHDVTISSFTVEFPDEPGVEYPDSRQNGTHTAGTTYLSDGWNMGGAPMPTGDHIIRIVGSWSEGSVSLVLHVTVG